MPFKKRDIRHGLSELAIKYEGVLSSSNCIDELGLCRFLGLQQCKGRCTWKGVQVWVGVMISNIPTPQVILNETALIWTPE